MGPARRDAALPVPWRHFGTAAAARPAGPHPVPGPSRVPPAPGGGAGGVLPGGAGPPPGPARRQRLRRGEGGRGRVHPRGRRDAGHVRLPGGAGHRQRPHPPGGAAGPDRPGDPDQHLAGGRRRLRRQDGRPGVVQPGGEKDRGRAAGAGPVAGATAGGADRPAGRRAGGLPQGIAPGPGAEHRRDGAGRRDRAPGPRRPQRHHADQRHSDPLGGGRDRVLRGDPAGPDRPGGAGAAAGRVPGHGEPRAAHPR